MKLFFRYFRKYRIFNLINILGLALGLATVLVLTTWVDYHLSFDSFFPKHDRIFRVVQKIQYENNSEWVAPTPTPLGERLPAAFPEIETAARVHYGPDLILNGNNKSLVEDKAIFTDSSFLSIFDLNWLHEPVSLFKGMSEILINESTAFKYFGTSNVIGRSLRYHHEQDLVITGVFKDLPENSHLDFNVILPLEFAIRLGREIFTDTWHPFDEIYTYVLIKPGTDPNKLKEKTRGFKTQILDNNRDELRLQELTEIHTDPALKYDISRKIKKSRLYTFGSVSILLLVVAVFNFVIFSIALSSGRKRESGIRKIIGANRNQILLGQLLESFFMAAIAIISGIILIELFEPMIQSKLNLYLSFNDLFDYSLLIPILIILLLITLTGGFFSGTKLGAMKTTSVFTLTQKDSLEKNQLIRILVILQFTISICLMIFAMTINAQIRFIEKTDVGFDKDRLVSIRLFDKSKMTLFNNLETFVEELKSYSGIEDVTFAFSSPTVIETSAGNVEWDGKPADQTLMVQWNTVFYNYFKTIGVDIVSGRDFSENFENELVENGKAVFIINEKTVREMGLTNQEVLGRNFTLYDKTGPVIGVVENFHYKSLHEEIAPMAFFMSPFYYNEIIVRTSNASIYPIGNIKKTYGKLFPDTPLEFEFVSDQYTELYMEEKNLLSFNSVFALLMIIISVLGLSSISFLFLKNKTKEIGIRKINGASVIDILKLLALYFTRWIGMAVLIGIPVSYLVISNWLNRYAYKTPQYPFFYIVPVLLLISISFIGIIYQVKKAARTNPVEVLRYE